MEITNEDQIKRDQNADPVFSSGWDSTIKFFNQNFLDNVPENFFYPPVEFLDSENSPLSSRTLLHMKILFLYSKFVFAFHAQPTSDKYRVFEPSQIGKLQEFLKFSLHHEYGWIRKTAVMMLV